MRDLVAPGEPQVREHAAAELVEADLFVAGEPVFVAHVSLSAEDRALREHERNVLVGWVERIGGRLSGRRHVGLVRRDHGLLLLSDKDPMISGKAKEGLLGELTRNLERDLDGVSPVVGVGEVKQHLTEAFDSYREASRAARVARLVPGMGRVVPHDALGVYDLLTRIPVDELGLDALPSGLRLLLESGTKGEQLAGTLEAFLDNAGDVQLTAEQMFVHRTTLYYRLQRIEEITGAQLARGEDRLAFHLGLKIARLVGLRQDATGGPAGV